MVLLRDVGHVETRSGPFGDSVNHDAKIDARFAPNAHRLRNHFGRQPMVLLRDVGQVETRFDPFGDTFNLGTR